ncbi:MAG: exosortase [Gemmatimonadaceae bacterium]
MSVSLMVVLLAHAGTLSGLVRQWWSYLDYGYALVALVAWVCWRDRALLLVSPVPWWPALPLVGASVLLWFVGAGAGILVLEQLALLGVLTAWALGMLGLGQVSRVLRLAAYLAIAMPAWGLITPVLQQVTVMANSVLLAMAGLQADIRGTYIAIPEGTFEVAGSCAGLSFFMTGLAVAVAYWEVSSLSPRGRWLALGLMVLLSLVSNWIRVFLLILIGHWTKMQSPLMGDHGWFGWVLFAGMLAIFLTATRGIERRYPAAPLDGTPAPAAAPSSLGAADYLPLGRPAAGPNLLLAAVGFSGLAVVGPLGLTALERVPRDPSPAQVVGLRAGAAWSALAPEERPPLVPGDTVPAKPWAPRYFGADRHVMQSWTRGVDTVQVDRLIFAGRGPRRKLFADGNAMALRREILLDRPTGVSDGTGIRSFRQAVVRTDSTNTRAMLYWFRVGTSATGVPLVGRLLQVGSALTRSMPAELIVASTPCRDDCTTAFAALSEVVLGPSAAPNHTRQ